MPGNADSIFRAKETKSKKAERKCDKEGRNRKNDTQDPEETPVIVDVKMFSPSKHHRAHWKHIPWKHQRMFRDIRTLGRIQFDSYWDHPTPEASQYPWRKERIKRAETLVHFAEKCAKLEQLLEADWRAEVEPRIFDRFSIEVACRRCRKRLWRSEIEVDPKTGGGYSKSLEERQKNRKACRCPPSRKTDSIDIGISNIFSQRIENDCNPNPRAITKPDRIHGLDMTEDFEKLLGRYYRHNSSVDSSQQTVGEAVPSSMSPGGQLLYPFLVMEAKSAKNPDTFKKIETQTYIPIRRALSLQHTLLCTSGNRVRVPGGPLVWFLANKGESWRVYGAYVREEQTSNNPAYGVTRLWEGNITGSDDALQLVCIVDYIIDWARDIYRPNILRQLKSLGIDLGRTLSTVVLERDHYFSVANSLSSRGGTLSFTPRETPSTLSGAHHDPMHSGLSRWVNNIPSAHEEIPYYLRKSLLFSPGSGKFDRSNNLFSSPSAMSILTDNDRHYSLENGLFNWINNSTSAHLETPTFLGKLPKTPIISPGNAPNSSNDIVYEDFSWMVRNVRKIESRVRGLFITEENIPTLLPIFKYEFQQVEFIENMKEATKNSYIVLPGADLLHLFKAEWTSQPSFSINQPYRYPPTVARIQATFFIGPQFELVRELTYLAITRPAYQKLFGDSLQVVDWQLEHYFGVDATVMSPMVQFRNYCKYWETQQLSLCLARESFCFYPPNPADPERKALSFYFLPEKGSDKLKADTCILRIVNKIYDICSIGRRKPKEPFLLTLDIVHEIAPQAMHKCNKHSEGVLAVSPAYLPGFSQPSEVLSFTRLCFYHLAGKAKTKHSPLELQSWVTTQIVPLMKHDVCIVGTDRRGDNLPDGLWDDKRDTTHYLVRNTGTVPASGDDATFTLISKWITSLQDYILDLEDGTKNTQSREFELVSKSTNSIDHGVLQNPSPSSKKEAAPSWSQTFEARHSPHHSEGQYHQSVDSGLYQANLRLSGRTEAPSNTEDTVYSDSESKFNRERNGLPWMARDTLKTIPESISDSVSDNGSHPENDSDLDNSVDNDDASDPDDGSYHPSDSNSDDSPYDGTESDCDDCSNHLADSDLDNN